VLQKVDVPVVTNDKCQLMYSFNIFFKPKIDSTHLCAGWRGGADSCQGDSGGPLFATINGVYTEIGIVSEGFMCAKIFNPGKYTRVSSYIDWIKAQIAQGAALMPISNVNNTSANGNITSF
jgi:trypsin